MQWNFMAWIFDLAAEFGRNQSVADKFRSYFSTQKIFLCDGQYHQCHAQLIEMYGSIWCVVVPDDLSRSGVQSVEDQKLLSDAGIKLYDLLKETTGFRYACVGIEADGIGSFEEVREGLARSDTPGLVIAEGVFSGVKPMTPPEVFIPGYLWWPYSGEE